MHSERQRTRSLPPGCSRTLSTLTAAAAGYDDAVDAVVDVDAVDVDAVDVVDGVDDDEVGVHPAQGS